MAYEDSITEAERPAPSPDRATGARTARAWWQRPDPYIAVALFGLGLIARAGGLPGNGLVYDDAWVSIGASKASPTQIFNVGVNHPGFIAFLTPWARLASPSGEWMAIPAFLVGSTAAPIFYLVLRRWRVDRAVSMLTAALVVVMSVHVLYSGRVKPYVFEGVIILILAALLPRLARLRWTWATVAAWVAVAVILNTFTVFVMLAMAIGVGILALHPNGDRGRRWTALAVQGAISALYLWLVQSMFDSALVSQGWENVYNGYIELNGDPLDVGRQVASHIAQWGGIVLGGGKALTLAVALIALAGLAWESWRGRRRLPAQFLLALPLVALIGAMAGQIPFGTTLGDTPQIYPGTHASLWLLPSLVVGLAFALDAVAAPIRRKAPVVVVPLACVLIALGAVVIGLKIDDVPTYPSTGSESAAEFVRTQSGPGDVVIMLYNGLWSYAATPDVGVRVVPGHHEYNGYQPRFTDDAIWLQAPGDSWDGTAAQMEQRTRSAPKVLVVDGYIGLFDQAVPKINAALKALGYEPTERMKSSTFSVQVWARPRG